MSNTNELRKAGKPGVKWQPGGSPEDYFFEEVPNWTVSNALNRLLTKVRNNPNRTITIQKFIKDSCKGNLKTYFETVREGMGKGDSVVMAEVAYKSFIQLTTGPNPLLRIFPPKSKPRTRAAAVSEEGYAYKDYIVQVTEHGFEFMRVKPVYDDTSSPPRKQRKLTNENGLMNPSDLSLSVLGQGSHPGKIGSNLSLIPLISEQEQEVATNMLLYFKASIDGLLATIVHLRSENQNLQKENMTFAMLNNTLQSDYEAHKTQLIKITQFIQQQQEMQHASMMPENQQQYEHQSMLLQEQQMQQQQQELQHQQLQHQQQLQQQQLQHHLQQEQQQQLQQLHQLQHQQHLQHQQLQQHQLQLQPSEYNSHFGFGLDVQK